LPRRLVGRVVAGGEVGALCWFTFVGATRFDGCRVRGVDQFIRVADNPDVEPGLAELALT
jgi:hypothetical protein